MPKKIANIYENIKNCFEEEDDDLYYLIAPQKIECLEEYFIFVQNPNIDSSKAKTTTTKSEKTNN